MDSMSNIIPVEQANIIKTLVDPVGFGSKPTGADMGGITRRMEQPDALFEGTASGLAEMIADGHTFCISYAEGGTSDASFVSSDLVGLDFDNGTTLDAAMEVCRKNGIEPCIVYRTFSDGAKGERFRIMFRLSERVTDREEYKRVVKGAQAVFSGMVDSATVACVQRFHGTNHGIVLTDDNPTVAPDVLASRAEEEKGVTAGGARRVPGALDGLLERFDFVSWLRSTYPAAKVYRKGDGWCFNPCPLCGHRDCFVAREDGKFNCFSCGHGGNSVISFLMQAYGMDKAEAVRTFKHDIMGEPVELPAISSPAARAVAGPAGGLPPYMKSRVNKDGTVTGYQVSAPLLAEWFRSNVDYLFARDSTGGGVRRYIYRNGVYRPVSDDELRGYLKQLVSRFDVEAVRMRDINDAFADLATDARWTDPEALDADENVINFTNGLLHIDDMKLYPHDPHVLSTIQIPCEWSEEDEPTPVFDRFMDDLTNGDEGVRLLLMEYMALCLSNVQGWRTKKCLFLTGPGNCGKSQLKSLTERLIGRDQCAAIDLRELEGRFGTAVLCGKRLAGSSDMGYLSVSDLRTLKRVTGGDALFAEYKGQNGFSFTYRGLLWFCANRAPRFGGDHGKHVYERLLLVELHSVVPEDRRDPRLLDKMFAERACIVRKLVPLARRVVKNGYRFDIPQACMASMMSYERENDTVAAFVAECCAERTGNSVMVNDAYTKGWIWRAYKGWCAENTNGFHETRRDFETRMVELYGDLAETRRTSRSTYYRGITAGPGAMEYI